ANGPYHQSLTVISFSGAAIGSTTSGSGSRNPPNLLISGTVSGSLVFAVGFDADQPTPRTLPAGEVMVHQWVDNTRNCTMWVQAFNDRLLSGAFATLGFTSPTHDPWTMVAIEIVPHGRRRGSGGSSHRRDDRRFVAGRARLACPVLFFAAARRGAAPRP